MGVRAAMHTELIKTGEVSRDLGKAYDVSFKNRLSAEYGALMEVCREQWLLRTGAGDFEDRKFQDVLQRADGGINTLGATGGAEMRTGDVFIIETPGGGGFGSA